MLTRRFFETYPVIPSAVSLAGLKALSTAYFRARGVRMHYAGLEHVPDAPTLIVANSSHTFDVALIRWALEHKGIDVVIGAKGKNYHAWWMRFFCIQGGSLPLVSRGYIITMDYMATMRRRPSETTYRALRDHVDKGVPLAEDIHLLPILEQPRDILGYAFEPSQQTYAEVIQSIYTTMMQHTLRLGREAMQQGRHVLIFPQGSVSKRLSRGHNGAIQMARALDVQMLPLGVNGGAEAFRPFRLGRSPKRHITFRFGAPRHPSVDLETLPENFRPLVPADERQHRAILQHATDIHMERINGLLDEPFQWAPDRRSDGKTGTQRFV